MTRVCAWCGKILGHTNDGGLDLETHGICPDCAYWARKEPEELQGLLGQLAEHIARRVKQRAGSGARV